MFKYFFGILFNWIVLCTYRNDRPPLTTSILIELFLLGFVGYDPVENLYIYMNGEVCLIILLFGSHRITCNQGLYLLGLDKTSPTFASAVENIVPAVTFLIAALLGQAIIWLYA